MTPSSSTSSLVDAPIIKLLDAVYFITMKLDNPSFERGEKQQLKDAIAVVEGNAKKFEKKLQAYLGALEEESLVEEMLARASAAKKLAR